MERLTDKKVAADLKRNIEGLKAAGVEPYMSDVRYVKLAEYEDQEELSEAMKPLPSYIEVQPDNEWISVDNRLPEPETWVMIYVKYLLPVFEIERGIYKTGNVKKVFYDGKNFYCNSGIITHWQHLPEPPKEENNGQQEQDPLPL